MPPIVTPTPAGPGIGPGWIRLAEAVAARLPVAELEGIWVFRTVRRDRKDWGTAVLSRVDGDRRRIYTASFVLTVKGKARGQFESEIVEVGSGPLGALEELLGLVPRRAEDESPRPIPVATWFPAAAGEPAREEAHPGAT
jgi:hypothetical protein